MSLRLKFVMIVPLAVLRLGIERRDCWIVPISGKTCHPLMTLGAHGVLDFAGSLSDHADVLRQAHSPVSDHMRSPVTGVAGKRHALRGRRVIEGIGIPHHPD